MLVSLGKKLKSNYKAKQKQKMGRYLSPVRRIEKVSPIGGKRIVAMTFDDGPSKKKPEPTNQEKGLTAYLLDLLSYFNASATFDVIGTTENNYPDKKGKDSTPSWGGTKYDHYPEFNEDTLGGVKNCPDIIKRIIKEGSDIANHGYSHVAFGPERFIYGKREHFNNIKEVVTDLNRLDILVNDLTNKKITLARPPHYIDKIPDGNNAYDAYRIMGYNYLAASVDGGGWLPSANDYLNTVEQMVEPLKELLKKDPESLNGAIIFQKDGCNMSRQTPVADALYMQLDLLKEYNYEVVSVSKLLEHSCYEDINEKTQYFEDIKKLNNLGFCLGYQNNTFQENRVLTRGELAMMLTPPEFFRAGYSNLTGVEMGELTEFENFLSKQFFRDVKNTNPYFIGIGFLKYKGYTKFVKNNNFNYKKNVDVKWLYNILDAISEGRKLNIQIKDNQNILKTDIIPILKSIYNQYYNTDL